MEELGGPIAEFLKVGGPFAAGLAVGLGLYLLERRERMTERQQHTESAKEGSAAMAEMADALKELNRLLLTPRRRSG